MNPGQRLCCPVDAEQDVSVPGPAVPPTDDQLNGRREGRSEVLKESSRCILKHDDVNEEEDSTGMFRCNKALTGMQLRPCSNQQTL